MSSFDFNKCRDLEHPLCQEIIEACGLNSEAAMIEAITIRFVRGELATAVIGFYTSGVERAVRNYKLSAVEIV